MPSVVSSLLLSLSLENQELVFSPPRSSWRVRRSAAADCDLLARSFTRSSSGATVVLAARPHMLLLFEHRQSLSLCPYSP
jgi:hypothetical protein